MTAPGYWTHETTGALRPAIEAYLTAAELSPAHIATMRAYLRQWIEAPIWDANPYATETSRECLRSLRQRSIDGLTHRGAIARWLRDAMDAGMDPL